MLMDNDVVEDAGGKEMLSGRWDDVSKDIFSFSQQAKEIDEGE
jgi:hypothetical protein